MIQSDFVEAPSQMLENWCWQSASLRMMSGHYLDNSLPLPDDLLAKLIAAKDANVALLTKRQVMCSGLGFFFLFRFVTTVRL